MPSPPIQVFLTTIASQPALRQRQEYILRVLQVKKIPFISYDLASDEDAKRLWRRKAPLDKQQLPGIIVGGRFPGTFSDFEDAVEHDELAIFLRLNEEWDPELDGPVPVQVMPVGVPGASSPSQMRPDHKPSFAPQPSPLAKRVVSNRRAPDDPEELDAGEQLEDRSLVGVKVTEDELLQLVADLGLGGADADDLVKSLSSTDKTTVQEEPSAPVAAKEEPVEVQATDIPAQDEPSAPPAAATEEPAADIPVQPTEPVSVPQDHVPDATPSAKDEADIPASTTNEEVAAVSSESVKEEASATPGDAATPAKATSST